MRVARARQTAYHGGMSQFRPSRALAAIVTIFSLLFAQLAVAAYACPRLEAAVQQAAMPGCAEMQMQEAALCHTHCDAAGQSLDRPDLPQVQAFVPAALSVVLSPEPRAQLRAHPDAGQPPLTRSTAPPLAIRHCCFRI